MFPVSGPPAGLAPFENETLGPGVAVASRPPCIGPKARIKKTSAWRPKLRSQMKFQVSPAPSRAAPFEKENSAEEFRFYINRCLPQQRATFRRSDVRRILQSLTEIETDSSCE